MNKQIIIGFIGILMAIIFVSGFTSNSDNPDFYVGNSSFQLTGDWQQTSLSNNGTEFLGKDKQSYTSNI